MKRYWLIPLLLIATMNLGLAEENKLRDFSSMEEVYRWVDQDAEHGVEATADKDGRIDFTKACETLAIHMQERAEGDGYRLNIEIIDFKTDKPHALCMAHIPDWWVFIEPSTHQAWKAIPSRY